MSIYPTVALLTCVLSSAGYLYLCLAAPKDTRWSEILNRTLVALQVLVCASMVASLWLGVSIPELSRAMSTVFLPATLLLMLRQGRVAQAK